MRWIVLPPIVLLAMALAVANRAPVTFSMDPFDPLTPALGVEVPLFLVILISMLLGILIGGAGAWAQARRKAARARGAGAVETLPALRDRG
ncbi:MAG: DUF1049 domain-containing protein [Parvibaculum sp.]|nr:DUF1049 domain-containing protein [Parvibaculum sp.]